MRKKVFWCLVVFAAVGCSLVYSDYVYAQKQVKRIRENPVIEKSATEPETPAVGSTTLVISQVYPGGGSNTAGVTYTNDYVEIKNISGTAQSLNGLSLYYGSAVGNFASTATNAFALPNRSLQPGQYFLVQLGTPGTAGAALPVTPDASTTNLSMSASSGKVGLVNPAGLPINTCGATASPCNAAQLANFVDWVAYGAAGNGTANVGEGGNPAVNNGVALPANTNGGVRKAGGCTDSDNNNADFDVVVNPVPRNSTSPRTTCVTPYKSYAPVDLNGDGKTDYSVYRVTAGAGGHQLRWYAQFAGTAGGLETNWGLDTDAVTPGDFDGDGKDDIVVWRGASGTNSGFYILQSQTGTFQFVQFGLEGDDPYMIADYDGDGKDDVAIYRPGATAGAQSTFWWMTSNSGSPLANHPVPISWGSGPEDGSADFPVPGDFNGDGKADFCIYRNNGGFALFWIHPGSGGSDAPSTTSLIYFGLFSDTVVPGDYDGDGTTDVAVVRREGSSLVWYIRPSSGAPMIRQQWGLQSSQFNPDYPVQGDYDGDGKTDIAVWRDIGDNSPGDHLFYVLGSQGGVIYQTYGQSGDIPTALDTH